MYGQEEMYAIGQAAYMGCAARQPEVLEQLNELRAATEQAHASMLELRGRLACVTRSQQESANKCGEPQRDLVPLANDLRAVSQQVRQIAALAIDLMSRLEV